MHLRLLLLLSFRVRAKYVIFAKNYLAILSAQGWRPGRALRLPHILVPSYLLALMQAQCGACSLASLTKWRECKRGVRYVTVSDMNAAMLCRLTKTIVSED